MNRSRDYYRYQRNKHINRKKRIIHEQNDYWGYKFEGTLSKGKIHCSCWLCRSKSYDSLKMQDIRSKMKMDSLELEHNTSDN